MNSAKIRSTIVAFLVLLVMPGAALGVARASASSPITGGINVGGSRQAAALNAATTSVAPGTVYAWGANWWG